MDWMDPYDGAVRVRYYGTTTNKLRSSGSYHTATATVPYYCTVPKQVMKDRMDENQRNHDQPIWRHQLSHIYGALYQKG